MGDNRDKAIERMLEYDREVTRMRRDGNTSGEYYRQCVSDRDRWIDRAKNIIKGRVNDG